MDRAFLLMLYGHGETRVTRIPRMFREIPRKFETFLRLGFNSKFSPFRRVRQGRNLDRFNVLM